MQGRAQIPAAFGGDSNDIWNVREISMEQFATA